MQYNPENVTNLICCITYGSRLYGTDTAKSDYDFKVITLPSFNDLLLSKKLSVTRHRFDSQGRIVGDNTSMPDNGYEAEHIPVHKFVQDFMSGQAYAVELAFAVMQGAHKQHINRSNAPDYEEFAVQKFVELVQELVLKYKHKNINGMLGFAVKQTLDYVHRGKRLNKANGVLTAVNTIIARNDMNVLRLDSILCDTPKITVLDEIVKMTGLETGVSINHNKQFKTLLLNGREYLETTNISHFKKAVEMLVEQYGERSTRASETAVDWKSLSHAVRVYEQVIEYLETGFITFPRQGAISYLLPIKEGKILLEDVKDILKNLDEYTAQLLSNSTLPSADKLQNEVEVYFCKWLRSVYC